jgi:hypothetical protein
LTSASTSASPDLGAETLWKGRTINEDDLQVELNKAAKSNKSLILDTCAAGASGLAREARKNIAASVADLSYGNQGTHMLFATSDSKSAFEADDLKHGYLTYSLLRVLREGQDVTNHGKILSKSWLDSASKLCESISTQQGFVQKPRTRTVGDFSLGTLTDQQRLQIPLTNLAPGIFACRLYDLNAKLDVSLSNQVMESIENNRSKVYFSKAENAVGTNVYVITGNVKKLRNRVTLKVTLSQTTPLGVYAESPSITVTSTQNQVTQDVIRAAKRLFDGRKEWDKTN